MKLTHKLFHRMINRSCKLQGCSLIYTGMAKDLDVPVLSLTLGISDIVYLQSFLWCNSNGVKQQFYWHFDIRFTSAKTSQKHLI